MLGKALVEPALEERAAETAEEQPAKAEDDRAEGELPLQHQPFLGERFARVEQGLDARFEQGWLPVQIAPRSFAVAKFNRVTRALRAVPGPSARS